MFTAKTLPHLDRQRFTAEHVDHGQHPELLSVAELIMDKVERPCLVRPLRLTPRLAMHDHLAPPRLLCSQGQTFLAVQPVKNVAAEYPAFALQHPMHPALPIPDTFRQ